LALKVTKLYHSVEFIKCDQIVAFGQDH